MFLLSGLYLKPNLCQQNEPFFTLNHSFKALVPMQLGVKLNSIQQINACLKLLDEQTLAVFSKLLLSLGAPSLSTGGNKKPLFWLPINTLAHYWKKIIINVSCIYYNFQNLFLWHILSITGFSIKGPASLSYYRFKLQMGNVWIRVI